VSRISREIVMLSVRSMSNARVGSGTIKSPRIPTRRKGIIMSVVDILGRRLPPGFEGALAAMV
jgi:hypothetical protein